jgi:hypothetical protein
MHCNTAAQRYCFAITSPVIPELFRLNYCSFRTQPPVRLLSVRYVKTVETRKSSRQTDDPKDSRLMVLSRVMLWGLITCAVIVSLCLVQYGIYRLFFSTNPHFTIDKIEIEIATGIVSESYVRQHLELIEGKDNLYDREPAELRQMLLDIPLIHEADVRLIVPGTLRLTIYGRTPAAHLLNRKGRMIDDDGVVIFAPAGTLLPPLPLITGIPNLDSHATGEQIKETGVLAALEFLKLKRGSAKGNWLNVDLIQLQKGQLRIYLHKHADAFIEEGATIIMAQKDLPASFKKLFYILDQQIAAAEPISEINLTYDRVPVKQ